MTFIDDIKNLRVEIARLEYNLEIANTKLKTLIRGCFHKWGPIINDDIVTEGYEDPGDPRGTCGIDRQLPCWIPEKRIKRWKRTCTLCGKTETTDSCTRIVSETPNFGCCIG